MIGPQRKPLNFPKELNSDTVKYKPDHCEPDIPLDAETTIDLNCGQAEFKVPSTKHKIVKKFYSKIHQKVSSDQTLTFTVGFNYQSYKNGYRSGCY